MLSSPKVFITLSFQTVMVVTTRLALLLYSNKRATKNIHSQPIQGRYEQMKVNSIPPTSERENPREYEIKFQPTDLAQVIAENKKAAHPENSSLKVFSRTKKKIKREQITSQPAYSARDIKVELFGLKTSEKNISASDEILKIYLKKAALWSTSIAGGLSFFGTMNLGLNYWLGLSATPETILGLSALTSFIAYGAIESLSEYDFIKSKRYNSKKPMADEDVIQSLIESISSHFNMKPPTVICTLKPDCYLENKRGKASLTIGLPIIHKLNNHELIGLLTYHFQYFSLGKKKNVLGFFNQRSQTPFKKAVKEQHHIANTISKFSTKNLHNLIKSEAIISAIEASSFDHFVSALEKYHRLSLAFRDFIADSTHTEMIPINALTQLACNAESKETIHEVECLHLRDKTRLAIAGRQDLLELIHKRKNTTDSYKSHWMLKQGNELANSLSKSFLKKLGFKEEQLAKTHKAHRAFPRLLEVDAVQQYYAGFFRINRSVAPNLSEGDAGSLLTLKAELNSLNKKILNELPKYQGLIQQWDQFTAPHIHRQNPNTPESAAMEKTHLELQEIEELLGKKSGLCLAITLSIANPSEQKGLYLMLDAHRKTANLLRAVDATLDGLASFREEESSAHILQLRKNLDMLTGLCASLPRIVEHQHINEALDQVTQAKNTNHKVDIHELPEACLNLVHVIESYKWQVEKQLVDTCQKVEERLNVNSIHQELS